MFKSNSHEKVTSDLNNQFSFKRFFVNNIDSYHGEVITKQLSNILEKNLIPLTTETSQTALGEEVEVAPPLPPPQPYEIIGTVKDPKYKTPEYVARVVSKDEILPQMLTCGTVVLDVSYDKEDIKLAKDYLKLLKDLLEAQPPMATQTDPPETDQESVKKRQLILISTIMSWANTAPLDPDNPDIPFVETDFRKRKPHINYKVYYDIENEVIGIARKYRSQIGALVVAAGLTYGGREDVLYYWFQKAWECERLLPILGRGSNIVPIINVQDLAQIVYLLVTDFPKKLYILAVEQVPTKQREIIKPLGRTCGSGMFKCIPLEDAFLIPEMNQRTFDLMTLNLIMEPAFIVDTLAIPWTSEATFAEYVPVLMKDFKKERELKPFKVIIYGPPIVGKTTLTKMLCGAYGLMYISPDTVVQDIIDDLTWRLAHWEVGETADLPIPALGEEEEPPQADEDDIVDDEEVIENAKITLATLTSGRSPNEEDIIVYLRKRLFCREALNKGWVLDGFPTTISQCISLFDKGEEADSEEEDDEKPEEQFEEDMELYKDVLKKGLPDIVVLLDATDEFICEKAMSQPDGDPNLIEEIVLQRLSQYRANNTRELTPLNFFDELDIHPLVIDISNPTDYAMKMPYAEVALRMGTPCRYGKLMALIEAAEKKAALEIATLRSKEAKVLAEIEKKMQEDREEKMEYWSEMYTLLREEEEAALAVAGQPMRHYLVKHIFPTLTPALLEIAKLRPEDPIDYLAEYLFKLNPSGKMLEPGYNLQAELLLGKIKLLDDALMDLDIQMDPLVPSEADLEPKPKKDLKSMSGL